MVSLQVVFTFVSFTMQSHEFYQSLLFEIFSMGRFHPLLAKHRPSDPGLSTILPRVTALLSASTVSASVIAMVMEIVQDLLMDEDSEMDDGEERSLDVNDIVDVQLGSKQFTGKSDVRHLILSLIMIVDIATLERP